MLLGATFGRRNPSPSRFLSSCLSGQLVGNGFDFYDIPIGLLQYLRRERKSLSMCFPIYRYNLNIHHSQMHMFTFISIPRLPFKYEFHDDTQLYAAYFLVSRFWSLDLFCVCLSYQKSLPNALLYLF